MSKEYEDNSGPHDLGIEFVVCALQEAQVADEQGDFEEADAELIDRSTGKVDACIRDDVVLGTKFQRQTEAVFCFWFVLFSGLLMVE